MNKMGETLLKDQDSKKLQEEKIFIKKVMEKEEKEKQKEDVKKS
jgi:hypothetical protein